jgi:hypothetical protein
MDMVVAVVFHIMAEIVASIYLGLLLVVLVPPVKFTINKAILPSLVIIVLTMLFRVTLTTLHKHSTRHNPFQLMQIDNRTLARHIISPMICRIYATKKRHFLTFIMCQEIGIKCQETILDF